MRNIVLLIVMVLAGGAGWFLGSRSGHDAKEALAKAEAAGQAAKAEHEKEAGALKAQIATITAGFERDKKALAADHDRQAGELNAIIAGNKGRLADLDKARGSTQSEIVRLKAALAAAKTPQERQQIQTAITAQEQVQTGQTTQIAGLQCLDVPVPTDVLAAWRGSAP